MKEQPKIFTFKDGTVEHHYKNKVVFYDCHGNNLGSSRVHKSLLLLKLSRALRRIKGGEDFG